MSPKTARFLLGGGVPAAMLALAYIPFLILRSDLPDRLATHFDLNGTPDESSSVTAFVVFTSVLVALGVAGCVATALLPEPNNGPLTPILSFTGGFLGTLGGAILTWTAVSQRGVDRWQDASGPGWSLIAIIGVSLAVGAGAAWLAAQLPSPARSDHSVDPPAVMPLSPGEHAVWSSTLHSRWLLYLGTGLAVGAVALGITTRWWMALAPLVSAAAVLALSTLRVSADRSGLHVKYGFLPWPRTNVAVDRIATATAIDVRPQDWGGWGYRGSLALMRQAAVVHRAGPGVRLDLVDGKVFVVTVDDPQTPAALLNAEVNRLS